MHCSSCGADLPDRALRCPECEEPVTDAGTDDQSETDQSQPPGQSGQDPQPSQPAETANQSRQDQSTPPTPPEAQANRQSPSAKSPENPEQNQPRQQAQGQSGHGASQPGQQAPGQQVTEQPGQQASGQPAQQQGAQQPPGQAVQQAGNQPSQQTQGQPGRPAQGQPRQQRHGRSLGDRLGSAPVVGGLFYGLVAFVVNFFVTAMLVVAAAGEGDLDGYIGGVGNQGPGLLEVFGWFFYSAHNVDITAIGGGQSGSENFIEIFYSFATNPSVPKIAIYLAPAAVLFVLALVLASRASFDDDATAMDGAVAGGSIMLGYAVMTLVGATILFSYTTPDGQATVQPVLGSAVVFMCLLYPVASGGLAGYLVGQ